MRKALFWLHLIGGCIGGLVILVMCVTGVLLTYERQMVASAERGPYIHPSNQAPLAVEELLANAGLKKSANVIIRSAPGEPVEVNQGPNGAQFFDPSTGKLLGTPTKSSREIFNQIRAWHRWLAFEGPARLWGKAFTGACTLAFLGLLLSGLYLWLPKAFTWRHFRPILWFRGGLSGKARDFNWHNVIGIWSSVPLLFVIVSALPISYPWANQLIYTVTGTTMPKQPENGPPAKGEPNPAGLNRMLEVAKAQPGWQSITFRYGAGDDPVTFNIDHGDGGQPQLKATLTLDRTTATIVKQESFSDFNLGRQVRSYSRFLHTGESLGLVGQTVAGLVSLGGAFLVWTGLALAWRRFQNWRRRSDKVKPVTVPEPEPISVGVKA